MNKTKDYNCKSPHEYPKELKREFSMRITETQSY